MTPAEVWANVQQGAPDECWPWLGRINLDGYPANVHFAGQTTRPHRALYVIVNGPESVEGLDVDHCCHTVDCRLGNDCPHRRCMNLAHLTPCTRAENLERRSFATADRHWRGRQTHCVNGHPFTEANTIPRGPRDDWRRCRICETERRQAQNPDARNAYQRSHRAALVGTEPPRHGRVAYDLYRCRCDVCVSARREYDRERREAKRLANA